MADEIRRDFLKLGLGAAGAIIGLPLAAEAEEEQKVMLSKPISVRVLENKEASDGDRTETCSKIELTGSNGAVHRITGYNLKIERETSYDTTVILKTEKYLSSSDETPTDSDLRVVIISGEKGEVDGDFRNDEIQLTTFGPNGVFKYPAQSIRKSLADPYAGLSLDEKAQAIVDSRFRNPRQ